MYHKHIWAPLDIPEAFCPLHNITMGGNVRKWFVCRRSSNENNPAAHSVNLEWDKIPRWGSSSYRDTSRNKNKKGKGEPVMRMVHNRRREEGREGGRKRKRKLTGWPSRSEDVNAVQPVAMSEVLGPRGILILWQDPLDPVRVWFYTFCLVCSSFMPLRPGCRSRQVPFPERGQEKREDPRRRKIKGVRPIYFGDKTWPSR